MVRDKPTAYHHMPTEYFLQFVIPEKFAPIFVDEEESADVCFVSVLHKNNKRLRRNEFNIMFSVENMVAHTYDFTRKYGRFGNGMINAYIVNDVSRPSYEPVMKIPTVYLRINRFLKGRTFNSQTSFKDKKFCLFITRNARNEVKHHLVRFLVQSFPRERVDTIGGYISQIGNCTCYEGPALLELLSQYKFVATIENSNQDGYITEKIFNVFRAGSIPIYNGAPDVASFINPSAMLSAPTLDLYEKLLVLNENEADYANMIARDKIVTGMAEVVDETFQAYIDQGRGKPEN